MKISQNPVWDDIKAYKKPAHFFRFFVAKRYADLFPRSTFIGITGSVGKTSTTVCSLAVLSEKFKTISTDINLTSIFNIPVTLLKLRPNIKKVILEMGVEYPDEMDFYLSLVKPATAIITRISYAHSEFLGDVENIYQEKSKLIKVLPKNGFAILNWDDLHCRKMAKETTAEVVYFGMDPVNCHVWASNIKLENGLTKFELNYGVERVEILFQLLGRHMVYSALAAASLGLVNGFSLITIKKGLEKVKPIVRRLNYLDGLSGYKVIDDTYNASPSAVEESLNVLNEMPARRRIVVLGEMKELGGYSEVLHRVVAQKIYKDKIDMVILGTGDANFIADELIKLGYPEEKISTNLSNSQIVTTIIKNCNKDDLILIKGSHDIKLDEVVKRITKRKYG